MLTTTTREKIIPRGLLPADPAAADAAVLDRMRRSGADLSKPTVVTFYLYVPREADALKIVKMLYRAGLDGHLSPPDPTVEDPGGLDWGIVTNRFIVPSRKNIGFFREFFLGLARDYNGAYDGFEATIVKKHARRT